MFDFAHSLFQVSPWDRNQVISNWEGNTLYTKSKQMLCRKRISMLTGLNMSSLTYKYVFYRPGKNAKGEPHGAEF